MLTRKTLVLIACILMAIGIKAQEKYEYAVVIQTAESGQKNGKIIVSANDKYTERKITLTEGSISTNLTPILNEVSKMNADGWEVYSSISEGYSSYYYLRKRKN